LAAVFSNITGGILLSNFLLDLGANLVEIGTIASLPMLTNLLQPLGALLSNRTNSRRKYGIWLFLPARLMWLLLLAGIIVVMGWFNRCPQRSQSRDISNLLRLVRILRFPQKIHRSGNRLTSMVGIAT
jgi:uncharacterized membrane protein